MKYLYAAIILFWAGSSYAAQSSVVGAPQGITIEEFKGLNTDDSPLTLEDGQTPDSENIVTDEGTGFSGREGFVDFSTEPCRAFWELTHSNGTRFLVCQSSNVLKASDGDGTFDIYISTVNHANLTSMTNLGDRLYFANRTDGIHYADFTTSSATVNVVDYTLNFTRIATHKGRIAGIGEPGAERTLYLSEFNKGTNFTLVANASVTAPAQFVIGGAFDESLTGITPFQGKLILSKPHSTWQLLGSDRSDFGTYPISEKVGTAYPDSIEDCNGVLRWLGPERKVWEWGGGVFSEDGELTRKVDGLMETLVQGDANERTWIQSTSSDWAQGTLSFISTSASVGDIEITTITTVIDSWQDGDFSNPTWTTHNSVSASPLATSNLLRFDPTATISTTTVGINTPWTGNYAFRLNFTFAWTNAAIPGVNYRATAHLSTAEPTDVIDTTYATANKAGYAVMLGCDYSNSVSINQSLAIIETDGSTEILISSLATTAGYDYLCGGGEHSIVFFRNDSGKFGVAKDGAEIITGQDTTYTTFSHLSFNAVMNTSFGASNNIELDDFEWSPTTGTYITASPNIGTNIGSWGSMDASETEDDGSITYGFYTDTDSTKTADNPLTWTSSQTITNGTIPTLSTAAYAFVQMAFEDGGALKKAKVSDITLRWSEGANLATPALYVNGRYWLPVAISSTANNRVLVLDREREWQRYAGINAVSTILYNSRPLFSNADGTFQAESGFSDDGEDIVSYYTTKDYSPAEPQIKSAFQDLYLTTDRGDATLSTTYQLNGINYDYSLSSFAMNRQDGAQNVKLPFPADQSNYGNQISLTFSVTGMSYWRVLGARLDYVSDIFSE